MKRRSKPGRECASIPAHSRYPPLPADPVVDFDLEDVRRTIAEKRAPLRPEIEITGWIAAASALRPDKEHCRARTILPAQHRVSDQGTEGKVRIIEVERGGWAGTVRIDGVERVGRRRCRSASDRADVLAVNQLVIRARRRELTERRVRTTGNERLRE